MSVMSVNDHDNIAKDTEVWFPKGKTFKDSHQLFEMVKLFATKWRFCAKRDGVKIMCHLWPNKKEKRKEGKCPWIIGFYQDCITKIGKALSPPLPKVHITTKCYEHNCSLDSHT
jgi:hypothetical protein